MWSEADAAGAEPGSYEKTLKPDNIIYRPLLGPTRVQRRLEAARRGELTPEPAVPEEVTPAPVAVVGRPAPDFLATNLLNGQSARFQRAFSFKEPRRCLKRFCDVKPSWR